MRCELMSCLVQALEEMLLKSSSQNLQA